MLSLFPSCVILSLKKFTDSRQNYDKNLATASILIFSRIQFPKASAHYMDRRNNWGTFSKNDPSNFAFIA